MSSSELPKTASFAARSPSIARLLHSIKVLGKPHVVHQLYKVGDLDEAANRRETLLEADDTQQIACSLFEALVCFHARNIIDREIEPDNIFFRVRDGLSLSSSWPTWVSRLTSVTASLERPERSAAGFTLVWEGRGGGCATGMVAIGVLIFVLLAGGASLSEAGLPRDPHFNIMAGTFDIPSDPFDSVSVSVEVTLFILLVGYRGQTADGRQARNHPCLFSSPPASPSFTTAFFAREQFDTTIACSVSGK